MNAKKQLVLLIILFSGMLVLFQVDSSEDDKKYSIVKNIDSQSVKYFGESSALWIFNDTDALQYLQRLLKISAGDDAYYLAVQYLIPNRDRGGYSKGGTADSAAYTLAVHRIAQIIGNKPVIVIIEPDELCFEDPDCELLKIAVKVYRQKCRNAKIFIDAGNPAWLAPKEVVKRLRKAGIRYADGFTVNVSSFYPTQTCIQYADSIINSFSGKKYIIDTSRNGGRLPKYPEIYDPEGIKIGISPTFNTRNPNCLAFLWIKPPGESDGRVAPAGTFIKSLVGI
jgi:endoglucanase